MQSLEQRSQEIRQANIERNIPCEMGDVDSLFYDLEKNVEIALLEKLYDDYVMFKRQQERETEGKEGEGSPDLPPLVHSNDDLGLPNLGNGLDFLDDLDNIDLMNLGEPQLRRAMY